MEDFYALRFRAMWEFFKKEHFSFWFTCAYLFFEYVRPQSIFPTLDFLPWTRLFLLGALAGWIADPKSKWVSSPANKWMIAFLVATITSIIFAEYRDIALEHFMDFFSWVIVYFVLILNANSRKRLFILIMIFLVASFKISLSLAYKWAARGFSFTSWGLQGPPGYFTNSGELSIQMLVYSPVAFFMYRVLKSHLTRFKKLAWVMMPITAGMTVIGASSRGAQLALLHQLYAFFLKGRLSIKSVVTVVIVLVAAYHFLPEEQKQRFSQAGDDKTSEQRLRYWKRGVQMIEEHPALGVGYFNFIPYFEAHYRQDMLYDEAQLPHNIFVQIGTDSGVIGLSCYLALILSVFFNNRSSRLFAENMSGDSSFCVALSRGLDAGMIGYLIAGQFVTVGYYPFLWVSLAFSTSLRNICQKEAGGARRAQRK